MFEELASFLGSVTGAFGSSPSGSVEGDIENLGDWERGLVRVDCADAVPLPAVSVGPPSAGVCVSGVIAELVLGNPESVGR